MPINPEQIKILRNAIRSYDYPAITFDFADGKEIVHDSIVHDSMRTVEATIKAYLVSGFSNNIVYQKNVITS